MENTPAAPFAPPVAPTVNNLFSLGHKLYKSRWGLIVGASVASVALSWLLGLITGFVDAGLFGADALVSPVTMLAQALVGAPLLVGPLYLTARLSRGEPAEFQDVLIGFRRWGPVVATAFLVQAAVWVAMIPLGVGMAAMGSNPFGIVVMFLLGLAALGVTTWLTIRLYFAPLLCADPAGPRPGVTDSIKASWTITKGHALTLFVVSIALGVIGVISALLLVVPFLLYGAPLGFCVGGVAYVLVTHQAGLIPMAPYDDCPFCKYDLRGTASSTCPECGATVPRPGAAPVS